MNPSSPPPDSSPLPLSQQLQLIKELQIFKIQGCDRRGRPLLRIIGKFFPARLVSAEATKKFLEDEIFPNLEGRPFSAVYVHTEVSRGDNFPGISALKSIYDAVPGGLEAVYFLHPGIQSRLFLAAFGRLIFGGAGYGKVKYVSRLEFLWEHVRRKGAEIPEFVHEFDEEMEWRPTTVDYGIESDHPAVLSTPFDSTVPTYSMRCIA
ncbi:hypothetical protein SASPL_149916 [Salvia splendens]|uniref:CRAL-TRIO domain-containing protein n=1 Tax=Salvia splendens TaxID=180675 RepID=A0A8X8W5T4_SALSN|nr:protein GDAP2 homolog [Salvia splendens]KAG6388488.1 hypothetical protein SASPL_149916 [Salvia splendens]